MPMVVIFTFGPPNNHKISVIYRASIIQWPDGQSVMFTLRPPNNYKITI